MAVIFDIETSEQLNTNNTTSLSIIQDILSDIQEWANNERHSPTPQNLKKFVDEFLSNLDKVTKITINNSIPAKNDGFKGGSINIWFKDENFLIQKGRKGLIYRNVLFSIQNGDYKNYEGLAIKAVFAAKRFDKEQSIDIQQGNTIDLKEYTYNALQKEQISQTQYDQINRILSQN